MFGGVGIYADDAMFALVADDIIYLKADEKNAPAFDREGLAPFTYSRKPGRQAVMSYRRMPDRLYDDPDELARWASDALAAAIRKQASTAKSGARKRKTRPNPKSSPQSKSKKLHEKRPAKRPKKRQPRLTKQ